MTLSEKRFGGELGILAVGDVKQFIKDLKEELSFDLSGCISDMKIINELNKEKNNIIDELAGKELIE